MGGGTPRATTGGRAAARALQGASLTSAIPAPPTVIPAQAGTRAPTVIPAHQAPLPRKFIPPPFYRPLKKSGNRRDDEHRPIWSARGRLPPERTFSKVSFRGEVRWGVGGHKPAPTALPHPDRLSRHSCARSRIPCAPIRHSCAGRNPPAHNTHSTPLPNSSLPPFRGEVRWGVGRPEPLPAAERPPAPSKAHPSLPPFLRPPPSFLRRQEPAPPPSFPRTKHLSQENSSLPPFTDL